MTKDIKKKLGKNIKKIRKQNNLTQRQVAKILHINFSMYKEYENGTHFPRLEQLIKGI